jgi:hypothetical protein
VRQTETSRAGEVVGLASVRMVAAGVDTERAAASGTCKVMVGLSVSPELI